METAETIVTLARWWLYAGLGLAAAFLLLGLDRLDENARGAFVFRVLLIPGLVLLWPLVLYRWVLLERGAEDPQRRHRPPLRAHWRIWRVLAGVIPLVFLAALALNEAPGTAPPAERLEAAQ